MHSKRSVSWVLVSRVLCKVLARPGFSSLKVQRPKDVLYHSQKVLTKKGKAPFCNRISTKDDRF